MGESEASFNIHASQVGVKKQAGAAVWVDVSWLANS